MRSPWVLLSLVLALHVPAGAKARHAASNPKDKPAKVLQAASDDGVAEARLMQIYQLMGSGRSRRIAEQQAAQRAIAEIKP